MQHQILAAMSKTLEYIAKVIIFFLISVGLIQTAVIRV